MMLSGLNGIAARIMLAILLAIMMVIAIGTALTAGIAYFDGGRVYVRASSSGFGVINPSRNSMILAGKITLLIRAVGYAPRSERPRLIAALADPEMPVVLDAPLIAVSSEDAKDESLDWLRQMIQAQMDETSQTISISARSGPTERPVVSDDSASALPDRRLEVALPDGQRMSISLQALLATPRRFGMLQLIAVVLFAAVVVAFWTARRLASPIRQFAGAAERLGVDLTARPLAVRGPKELRMTIMAFNRMQERLRRFLEDRTQMLAAISHDLRAPLARLRLRAELVADGEQQRKMFDDLDVMNTMIESTLAFARDDSRGEARLLVDLGVLVGDVCEDVADTGGDVSYLGPRDVDVPCRPSLLRRAVANLIDNAVKYGRVASVRIVRDHDRVAIVVDDNGPGIPSAEQEKVFAPFYRMESARDPGKPGVGLGLSVARTIAREHGGDVTLTNRDGGGLSARIELPER